MEVSCGSKNTVPLLLSLLLVSVIPFSSSLSPSLKVTEALLQRICSQPPIQRTFCIQQLKSNPRTFHVDLHGLLGLTIETAKSDALSNLAMFKTLAKSISDSTLRAQYESCSNVYTSTTRKIERTQANFRARAYLQVLKDMSDAFDLAESCADEFEGPSTEPPLVPRHNEIFENFCNIVRAIAGLLV